MDRRLILVGLAALGLEACAPGRAPAPSGSSRHGQQVTGFIPTPEAPRTDGRLTLIWFYEPE